MLLTGLSGLVGDLLFDSVAIRARSCLKTLCICRISRNGRIGDLSEESLEICGGGNEISPATQADQNAFAILDADSDSTLGGLPSMRAFLQSIMPAEVILRNFITSAAVIVIFSLL